MTIQTDDIEQRINEFFEENLAALALESGHSLSPEVRALPDSRYSCTGAS
jgi:hypothetical protein